VRLLSVRLILSLILAITLVSLLSSYYQVRAERRSLQADLERRAAVLAESLAGNIDPLLEKGSIKRLQGIVERFSNRERLAGVAILDTKLEPIAQSAGLARRMQAQPSAVAQAIAQNQEQSEFVRVSTGRLHVYVLPLHRDTELIGELVIVHDASYIDAQITRVWRETFLRVLAQVFLIVLITVLIVRWSIAGPIARAAQWMRALRTGKAGSSSVAIPESDLLRPLTREMKTIAESLTAARSAAEREAQLREAAESSWTADRLSVHVRGKLGDSQLFVVSNREPYSHVRQGKAVQAIVPASGVVTALEPVLCACDGTWVAHGSGDADREMVDGHDRLRVPPEEPKYTLRRVWLTKGGRGGLLLRFCQRGNLAALS
jgi:trehalose 6-phosphate synthase